MYALNKQTWLSQRCDILVVYVELTSPHYGPWRMTWAGIRSVTTSPPRAGGTRTQALGWHARVTDCGLTRWGCRTDDEGVLTSGLTPKKVQPRGKPAATVRRGPPHTGWPQQWASACAFIEWLTLIGPFLKSDCRLSQSGEGQSDNQSGGQNLRIARVPAPSWMWHLACCPQFWSWR